MKIVRLCLLLLLVVLLPVRGVMAGAMLCPGADSGSQVPTHLQHDDQSSAQSHARHAMHEAGDETMTDAHHEHATSDHNDKCTMCSALCSLTPLANTPPAAFPALDLASTNFPALATPDPSFLSDGQDRPPRSI